MRDSDIDSLTANGAQESPPRPLSQKPQLDRPDLEELRRLANPEVMRDVVNEAMASREGRYTLVQIVAWRLEFLLDELDTYAEANDSSLALLSERQDLELQDLELQNVGLEVSARGWMDRANAAESRIAELEEGLQDLIDGIGVVLAEDEPLEWIKKRREQASSILSSSGGDKE